MGPQRYCLADATIVGHLVPGYQLPVTWPGKPETGNRKRLLDSDQDHYIEFLA